MPLFGKRPPKQSDEERAAAEIDLDRIRDGGIPLGAEERLRRLASVRDEPFSSDLSVNEYAIALKSGLQPIAQVMGSSVVQHGWQNYQWAGLMGLEEMPSFAEPWNLSRQRSFDRLREEAALTGADAVIGIEMNARPFLDEPNNVEYVVFGTAVRETTLQPGSQRDPGRPRLSTLSGQDVDKLRRIGAETRGVVGHTTVMCVALSPWASRQMSSWWGNQEMVEVTQAVYEARRVVMGEIRRQGANLDANDMVISTLDHDIYHHEYEHSGGYTQHLFIVTMHVLATAIRLGAHEPHPSPLGVPVMSINLSDR